MESKITRHAQGIVPKNTFIPFKIMKDQPWAYQAHLERIADFLLKDGVWQETASGVEFLDVTGDERNFPKMHHFRSTTLANDLKYVGHCWLKCEEHPTKIPAFIIKNTEGKKQRLNTIKKSARPTPLPLTDTNTELPSTSSSFLNSTPTPHPLPVINELPSTASSFLNSTSIPLPVINELPSTSLSFLNSTPNPLPLPVINELPSTSSSFFNSTPTPLPFPDINNLPSTSHSTPIAVKPTKRQKEVPYQTFTLEREEINKKKTVSVQYSEVKSKTLEVLEKLLPEFPQLTTQYITMKKKCEQHPEYYKAEFMEISTQIGVKLQLLYHSVWEDIQKTEKENVIQSNDINVIGSNTENVNTYKELKHKLTLLQKLKKHFSLVQPKM